MDKEAVGKVVMAGSTEHHAGDDTTYAGAMEQPAAQAAGLTDAEIEALWWTATANLSIPQSKVVAFARALLSRAASSGEQAEPDEDDDDDEVLAGRVEWDKFPGWLIDHHEGDTITEELLQHALADMLKVHPPVAQQAEQPVALTYEDKRRIAEDVQVQCSLIPGATYQNAAMMAINAVASHFKQAAQNERCALGVGCEDAGICYADAHGQPDQCGRAEQPEQSAGAVLDRLERVLDGYEDLHESEQAAEEARGVDTAIARSKRILALVDDYAEQQTSERRTALRAALMNEFEALLAAPAAGTGQNEAVRRAWEGGQALQRAINQAATGAQGLSDYFLGYRDGWTNAAKWADRVDLVSSIGSVAYFRDLKVAFDRAYAASRKGES